MAEKERLFRPVDKKVSGVWLACDVVKGSHVSHGRHFVGIRRLVLLQQAIRQDVPRCGAFRVGTVRFQPLCAYGQTAADGSARQTAYSRMDTHRCFRQGNKNVFYRYVSRAASYDDCERRGGLAGPLPSRRSWSACYLRRNNTPTWTCTISWSN